MNFAQNLNYLMTGHNFTNYKLAKILSVSQTSVANWISGDRVPHKKTQIDIAQCFNISLEELMGENLPPIRDLTGDGQKKEPAGQKASGLDGTNYGKLSPENRRFIDDMIEKLLKSQSAE